MKTARTARTALALLAAGLVAAGLVAAAGGCTRLDAGEGGGGDGGAAATDRGPAAELRLGYLPNVTHAAALIGVRNGLFAAELGTATRLTTQAFNDGTEEVGALLGGSLDIAFVGPGPAINAFDKSGGKAVRLIAGATSGGAQLVARPGISTAEQLRGRTVATPKLGNTQDIALKAWLAGRGIPARGGAAGVTIVNADNPQTFAAFRAGELDAAWLPEPWASRLVLDAGATVLVDEGDLWPDGRYPTTVVLARTGFLREHPQTVLAFLRGQLAAVEWAAQHPAGARQAVNAALAELTGKPLADPVIARAFDGITLTADPLAGAFPRLAANAVTAGVARAAPDLAGFADLGALNAVLGAAGRPAVDAAGLDTR